MHKKQFGLITFCFLLSMASCATPHVHTPNTPVIENKIDATCTKEGSYDLVTYCKDDNTEISREHKIIPALGHNLIHHNAKAPTCLEEGWEEYDTCSRCDYSTYKAIEPTGHSPMTPVVENRVKPTCTEDGSYDLVTYCADDLVEISREHVVVPALGHNLVHHDAKAPTCVEVGNEEYEACTRCDYSTRVEIPALGHDLIHHDAKDATCVEAGWEEYDTCSRCDYSTYKAIEPTGHTPKAPVEENRVEASCTEDGSYDLVTYCEDDNVEISREHVVIPAKGHDFVGVAHGAACDKNGHTHQTCTVCGYETDEEWATFSNKSRIEKNGDAYWDGVHKSFLGFSTRISGGCDPKIGTNLTITINEITTGTKLLSTTVKYYGSYDYDSGTLRLTYNANFNFTFTVSISTTDNVQYSFFYKYSTGVYSEAVTYPHHEFGEWVLEKEATCTENGNRYHECSICKERFNQSIPAKGHTLSDWIIDEEATCEHDGRRHKVCSVCNAIVNEEIIPSDHNYEVVSRTSTSLDLKCKTCGEEKHYEFAALSVSGTVTGVGQSVINGKYYNTNDITASASGGYGTKYQFRFELYYSSSLVDSQDYSTKKTFKALMTYGYSGFKLKIYVKDELNNTASVNYTL